MRRKYIRKKSSYTFACISILIFLLCAISSIIMIVKEEYAFLMVLLFPVLLGVLFALIALIEYKGSLEIDENGIHFNYRVFSKSKELNRTGIYLQYDEIKHIQMVFKRGDGIFTLDTTLYKFLLVDNREIDVYFHHFGRHAEKEIITVIGKNVSVKA